MAMGLFQTQEHQGVKEELRVRVPVNVSSTVRFRVPGELRQALQVGPNHECNVVNVRKNCPSFQTTGLQKACPCHGAQTSSLSTPQLPGVRARDPKASKMGKIQRNRSLTFSS